MQKTKPHYDLTEIKKLIHKGDYFITKTAVENARNDFKIKSTDIPLYIEQLNNTHFYKSMTCNNDNKIWQDVYHLPIKSNGDAYIKLQISFDNKSVIIQFKGK